MKNDWKGHDSVRFNSDGISPRTLPLVSESYESDETGSMFRLLSLNRSCAGEPTMADPIELSSNVSPFTVLPNAVEVLERLRDSYKGLSERDSLSGVDRAVLAVVEMTLKHVAGVV